MGFDVAPIDSVKLMTQLPFPDKLKHFFSTSTLMQIVFWCGLACLPLSQVNAQSAPLIIVLEPIEASLVDSNTDDSVRIKAAIVEAHAAGGGTVLLRPGTYHVANPLNVLSNVNLKGYSREGENATIIRLVDNAPSFNGRAGIIRLKDDAGVEPVAKRVRNIIIEDLFIDGNRDNQTQGVGDSEKKFGIYSEGDYITIRRVTTANCMGYGFDPHGVKASDESPAISSKFMLIEDNLSYNNFLDGFTLDHLEESVFRNNVAHSNDRHGINIVTHTNELTVSNNLSYGNGSNGIMVQNGAERLRIEYNQIYRNQTNGIHLRDSEFNTLKGNSIYENQYSGIRVRGSTWNHLVRNDVFDNSRDDEGSYYEIRIDAYQDIESENNKVVYNRVESTGKGAIGEEDQSDYNRILYNNYATSGRGVVVVGDNSTEDGNQELEVQP